MRCLWKKGAALAAVALLALAHSWQVVANEQLALAHDLLFHLILGREVAAAWLDGVFYLRWVNAAADGWGAPIFIGYPPLGSWLLAAGQLATGSAIDGARAALLVVNLFAGLGAYVGVRRFASRPVAVLAAALYLFGPYRSLVAYHRFAFAELCAWSLVPWVLAFTWEVARRRGGPGSWIGLSVTAALLALTHPLTTYATLSAVLPLAALLIARSPARLRSAGASAAAGVCALALAAGYLLPLLAATGSTHQDFLVQGPQVQVANNFLLPGLVDSWTLRDGFLGSLDRAFLLQAALAIVPALYLMLRPMALGWLWLLLVLLWSLMQLSVSAPLWAVLPYAEYLQFPWRILGLQLVGVVWLFAYTLEQARSRRWLAVLWLLPAVAVLLLSWPFAWRDAPRTVGQDFPLPNAKVRVFEHSPRTVPAPGQASRRYRSATRDGAQFQGPGKVAVSSWLAEQRTFDVTNTGREAALVVRTYDYPGWRAYRDGRPTEHRSDRWGVIRVNVPRGRHGIHLRLEPTPARIAGAWIAGLTAFALALFGIGSASRNRRWPFFSPRST